MELKDHEEWGKGVRLIKLILNGIERVSLRAGRETTLAALILNGIESFYPQVYHLLNWYLVNPQWNWK